MLFQSPIQLDIYLRSLQFVFGEYNRHFTFFDTFGRPTQVVIPYYINDITAAIRHCTDSAFNRYYPRNIRLAYGCISSRLREIKEAGIGQQIE